MAAEIFTGVDAAWLHIDRPTNLAMIAGVMVLDTPLERTRLIELLQHRWLIYDRFQQRVREPLLGLGLPRWEFDRISTWTITCRSRSCPRRAGKQSCSSWSAI